MQPTECVNLHSGDGDGTGSSDRGWHEKPPAPHYDSEPVLSNLFAQQTSRRWPNTAATPRSSLPTGTRAHNCVFYNICQMHEEIHESITVIYCNSVVSLWGKKKTRDSQTFCPAQVAFQTNRVIVIHVTSRFIHGHGSRATALAISQILLRCHKYVTSPVNIRDHSIKYRRLLPFAGWLRLWRYLCNLFFTCGVSLSVHSRWESVWV